MRRGVSDRSGFESVHYHGRAPGEGVEVPPMGQVMGVAYRWLLIEWLLA
jgi:hypothetical protein